MIERNCVICGAVFSTYPSRVKAGRGKCCGRICSDSVTLIRPDRLIGSDTQFTKGTEPHNKKGWTFTKPRPDGRTYKLIYMPEHPNATKKGYVREHRLVMERVLGRLLESDEIVDHIDRFDTLNNDPSNLRVMKKVEHDRANVALNIHRRWYA